MQHRNTQNTERQKEKKGERDLYNKAEKIFLPSRNNYYRFYFYFLYFQIYFLSFKEESESGWPWTPGFMWSLFGPKMLTQTYYHTQFLSTPPLKPPQCFPDGDNWILNIADNQIITNRGNAFENFFQKKTTNSKWHFWDLIFLLCVFYPVLLWLCHHRHFPQLHRRLREGSYCAHIPSQWARPVLEWCLPAFSLCHYWPSQPLPAGHFAHRAAAVELETQSFLHLTPCFAISPSSKKTEWSPFCQVLSRVTWCSKIVTIGTDITMPLQVVECPLGMSGRSFW